MSRKKRTRILTDQVADVEEGKPRWQREPFIEEVRPKRKVDRKVVRKGNELE